VRYRLMATYRGAPYEAGIGPTERDVVLFAACPPPEELNFEPAPGHWRKQLRIEEVQALWESRPVGLFHGGRCLILDDMGERLHIAYLGHDAYQAERLGYWQIDRGVFELITPRDEVTDVVEERRAYDYPPRTWAAAPPDLSTGPLAAIVPVPGPGLPPDAAPTSPGLGWQPPPPPAPLGHAGQAEDSGAGVPSVDTAPLPVEAAALRAARAAQWSADPLWAELPQADQRRSRSRPGPKRAARRRQPAARVFAELASMAAIPATAYSIGTEADGALCLVPSAAGFEVFSSSAGIRREVRLFADEESAYFYMFGLLAAEAVQAGVLVPRG
jgi:hypothetical protein